MFDTLDLDPNKKILFTTVPHSVTTSARMMLDKMPFKYKFTHCEKLMEPKLGEIIDEFNIITTYRDPYLVAASWVNRRPLDSIRSRHWIANWKRWAILAPHAVKVFRIKDLTVHKNQYRWGDTSGAYAAYEAGDFDRYFQIVPKHLILFAVAAASLSGVCEKID
jgi:hypothetical protein